MIQGSLIHPPPSASHRQRCVEFLLQHLGRIVAHSIDYSFSNRAHLLLLKWSAYAAIGSEYTNASVIPHAVRDVRLLPVGCITGETLPSQPQVNIEWKDFGVGPS